MKTICFMAYEDDDNPLDVDNNITNLFGRRS